MKKDFYFKNFKFRKSGNVQRGVDAKNGSLNEVIIVNSYDHQNLMYSSLDRDLAESLLYKICDYW